MRVPGHAILWLAIAAAALNFAGCESANQLPTRAYRVTGQTDIELINAALTDEFERHSTQSSSRVTDDGYAVVKTTSRAHRRIANSLSEKKHSN